MKHLQLLRDNNIRNTSTTVHRWIKKLPASHEEKEWLIKTFNRLYQIEQRYIVDSSVNDDKETSQVQDAVIKASEGWVEEIQRILSKAEPGEEEPAEEQEQLTIVTPPTPTQPAPQPAVEKTTSTLTQKLEQYLGDDKSKTITKAQLVKLGYQGNYPSVSGSIKIANQFTIKRKNRTKTNVFSLLKP